MTYGPATEPRDVELARMRFDAELQARINRLRRDHRGQKLPQDRFSITMPDGTEYLFRRLTLGGTGAVE